MDEGQGPVTMRGAATALKSLSGALDRVAMWGAVAALAVMVFSAGYQVVARYIFDAPPVWTEELARRAMVWAGMLGATGAFHRYADPNLFPGLLTVGGVRGKVMAALRLAGVAVFAAPILFYSLFGPDFSLDRGFIGRTLVRKAEMMGVSMAWFTVAVPLAFLIIVVHALAQFSAALAGMETVPSDHMEDSPL
ncbi:hypothetical protein RHIZO_03351 [Rhizobiaceae bacterium]|nr:hypothetical protein RHIZO_03351 [Rhizobiaceae bacterium]